MRTGDLARAAGVSVQAVRYYERRGLLKKPRRSPAGFRDYPAMALETVLLVKRLQEVGFTLRETSEFIRLLETHPRQPEKNRAIAEAKIRHFDEQIAKLRSMREELSSRLIHCKCCNKHD